METAGIEYIAAFTASFCAVFLKGFQHKNVIKKLIAASFLTSYAMAFVDVLLIGLVAKSTWDIAFAVGSGAAFGIVGAMLLHDRIFKEQ